MSLQQCCHSNIYNISPPSIMAIFLQHVLMAVIQSRYPVFYDRNTPIELGLLWQSSPILLLLVSHHWNLHSVWYTEALSISYISDMYIRLVVTL